MQEAVECDAKEVRTVFYIGEFSKMGKTTIKTLHHYDRIGLLHPEAVDGATGYRLYTTRQLIELHRIQALRQAGLIRVPSSCSVATRSNESSPRAKTVLRASHSCSTTKKRGFPWTIRQL